MYSVDGRVDESVFEQESVALGDGEVTPVTAPPVEYVSLNEWTRRLTIALTPLLLNDPQALAAMNYFRSRLTELSRMGVVVQLPAPDLAVPATIDVAAMLLLDASNAVFLSNPGNDSTARERRRVAGNTSKAVRALRQILPRRD
jgi:hypothetical protein